MSGTARAANKGGKHTKSDTNDAVKNNDNNNSNSKGQRSEKAQKNQTNKQAPVKTIKPSQEQLRIANLIKDQTEDPELKTKIKQVMSITDKSEEAVCAAMTDCDYDINRAILLLTDAGNEYEFISVKKKKTKPPVTTPKTENVKEKAGIEEELTHVNNVGGERRGRGRGRGGAPNDRGGKWRTNRENKENERTPDNTEFGAGGDRPNRRGRGMSNGPGRFGGRGGRGGGRMGPRTFQNRQDRDGGGGGGGFPRLIETWNNPGTDENAATGKMETWGEFPSPEDWDNEEYTGSLADTKVFTPSSANDATPSATEDGVIDTSFNSNDVSSLDVAQTNVMQTGGDELRSTTSPVTMPTTLTEAQSQFFSQFSAQAQNQVTGDKSQLASSVYSSSVQPSYATVSSPSNTSVSYTGTEFVNSYSSTLNDPQQGLPQRNKVPRTRVPPPSKIPASAVEMPPGDSSVNSGIGILDVQFGALDFGSDSNTFESSTDTAVQTIPKYSSQATDPISEHSYVNTSLAAAASQLQKTNHASLTSSLTKNSESLLNNDSSNYSTGRSTTFQELASMASKSISAAQDVNLHSANTYDNSAFPQPSVSLYQQQQQQQQNKVPISTYSVSSTSTYTPAAYSSSASNVYSSSGGGGGGGYSGSGVSGISNGSYSTNQYPNTTYASSSAYVPSGYQGYQPTNSIPSYQNGSGGGINQSYSYGTTGGSGLGSTNSYNSYQTSNYNTTTSSSNTNSNQHTHKLSTVTSSLNKDSQYENIPPSSGGVVSGGGVPSTISSTPSGLSSLTQQTSSISSSSSKTSSTNPSTAVNSKTNVTNIPPGVQQPVVGTQYIMSNAPALPYFPSPMYNFEDMSMLQGRIPPHMTTSYYEFGGLSGAPTSLPGQRDATGGLANVAAYSMSDGRYTRTDNNASPVPSSLSTQNASQTPLLNPTMPPTYYYYPSNAFQYSAAPIYPVPVTGHGTPISAQYKSSPAYGSASYGSTYEVVNQTPGTDYSKQVNTGGYASGQQPSKTTGTSQGVGGPTQTPSSNNDLSGPMYSNKTHASLSKVNSYEKAFHSGTPPPFNLAGVGNSVGSMGPTGGFTPSHTYTPMMMPQHHSHSATLMHQPHLQDSSGNSTSRSQTGSQVNKTGSKQQQYYGNWTQS